MLRKCCSLSCTERWEWEWTWLGVHIVKKNKNNSLGFFLYLRRNLNSLFRDCETPSEKKHKIVWDNLEDCPLNLVCETPVRLHSSYQKVFPLTLLRTLDNNVIIYMVIFSQMFLIALQL